MNWLSKPDEFDTYSPKEKLENINKRMNTIFSWCQRKFFRKRHATNEQYKEEYGDETQLYVTAAFQVIKEEYEEVREYALKNKNDNVEILEKLLDSDAERILLGDESEQV